MSEFWYYYTKGSGTRGPITFDELISLLSQLPTHRGVLVWREGFTDWTEAENVREIVARLIRPPPLRRGSSAIPPPVPVPQPESSDDFVDQYQQQFSREKISVQVGKRWSPWRAALYGFLFYLPVYVLSTTVNNRWDNELALLTNGRPGQIIGYFGGQFLLLPLVFAVVAVIRNLWVARFSNAGQP
jgi:hypothetical protein